ncbi:MAG: hypothetical protein KBD63_05825 [Bacteriovoracaceae bacterium]|nr:hypothetical protein [Bacteriovoracaceae bacterium]
MKFNLEDNYIRTSIKVFTFLMISFYPVSFRLSDDGRELSWIGLLKALSFGTVLNIGMFLTLSKIGLRWKIITLFFLLISFLADFCIFFLPYHVSDLAIITSYFSAFYVLFIIILVVRHKREKPS